MKMDTLIAEVRMAALITVAVFLGLSAFWIVFRPDKETYPVVVENACGESYNPCAVEVNQ